MGYAIIHMTKFDGGALRGIQSHMDRERTPKSNPDVDFSRSHENYCLEADANHLQARIKERIGQLHLKKAVRKDAVLCCGILVSASPDAMKNMSKEQQRDYFSESLNWIKRRYGAENVVYSVVHMDEATPHLHVGVIPVTGGKLSAKALFTKVELRSIQSDFPKDVGSKYGLERGQEGSERKHLSEMEFKAEMTARSVERLTEQESALKTSVADMERLSGQYEVALEISQLEADRAAKAAKQATEQEKEVNARLADVEQTLNQCTASLKEQQSKEGALAKNVKQLTAQEVALKKRVADMEQNLRQYDTDMKEVEKICNRGWNPKGLLGREDTTKVGFMAKDYLKLRKMAENGVKSGVLYRDTQKALNDAQNASQELIRENERLRDTAKSYLAVPEYMRPKVNEAIEAEQKYWQAYAHDTHRRCLCVYRRTPGSDRDKTNAAGEAVRLYAQNFRDVSDAKKLTGYVHEVVQASGYRYEDRLKTIPDAWRMNPMFTDFTKRQQTSDVPLPQLVVTSKADEPDDWRYLSETEKEDMKNNTANLER